MTSLATHTSGIGKVVVGGRFSGTAFRVGVRHWLTAFHVVGYRDRGTLREGAITVVIGPVGAEITSPALPSDYRDPRQDWILLQVEGVGADVAVLPLGPVANANVPFEVYGFPQSQPYDGLLMGGVVRNHRAMLGGVSAVQLFLEEAAADLGPSLKGASGSPVYVHGRVVALFRDVLGTGSQTVAGTVYATSVEPAARALGVWPDHCVGLPPLPPLPLPETPFPGLLSFSRAHARVFFGRCAELQRLWDILTGPNAPYVVILSGESGVGKSSLLDAGLLPRMEHAGWTTCYVRRPPAGFHTAPLSVAAGRVVLVLDQVEEIWTRPCKGIDEAGELLATLLLLRRPDVRVVLSLRREWYTALRSRVAALEGVPWATVDLWRLEESAIIQSITGVTACTDQEVLRRYPLTIAPRLADRMAWDLLEDRTAPLAPLLQIQLAAMWEDARGTPRSFDEPLYLAVRNRAGELSRFLNAQLATLPDEASVRSGLALDLLLEHVSPQGTAASLSHKARRTHYGERADKLVEDLKERRLLADADDGSRLAHDTLAPVVQSVWQTMATPGARARAVLESREMLGRALDPGDLPTIEGGLQGMRAPTKKEAALIQVSRETRRRRRVLLGVAQAVLAALVIAVVASLAFAYRAAMERQQMASRAALVEAETLCASNQEGARSAGVANIQEASLLGENHGVATTLARCLSRTGLAVRPTEEAQAPTVSDARAEFNLDQHDGVLRVYLTSVHTRTHSWAICRYCELMGYAVSPDGQRVAVNFLVGGSDEYLEVYEAGQPSEVLHAYQAVPGDRRGPADWNSRVGFGAGGSLVAWASARGIATVWDVPERKLLWESPPGEAAVQVSIAPPGGYVAAVTRLEGGRARLRVWDMVLADMVAEASIPHDELDGDGARDALQWDADDTIRRGTHSWHLEPAITTRYRGPSAGTARGEIKDLAISESGGLVAMATGPQDELRVLDVRGPHATLLTARGWMDSTDGVAFSPDEQRLYTGGIERSVVYSLAPPSEGTSLDTDDARSVDDAVWTANGLMALGSRLERRIESRPLTISAGMATWTATFVGRRTESTGALFDPKGALLLVERTFGRDRVFEERDLATGVVTDSGTRSAELNELQPFYFRGRAALLNPYSLAIESLRGEPLAGPRREPGVQPGTVLSLSPDGRFLAETDFSGHIFIWDLLDPRASPWRIDLDADASNDGAFDSRGAYFIAFVGSTYKVWSTTSRRELGTVPNAPAHPCLAADGSVRWLDVASGEVNGWDPNANRLAIVATLEGWPGAPRREPVVQQCAFVLSESHTTVDAWDLRTGAKLGSAPLDAQADTRLVTLGGRNVVQLSSQYHPVAWDVETGEIRCELPETREKSWTFSPAGTYAVGISGDSAPYTYHVVRVGARECTQVNGWENANAEKGISIADDGVRLLEPSKGGAVLVNTATKQVVGLFDGEDQGTRTTFVRGANIAAVGYSGGDVAVWDLSGPRLLYRLPGTDHAVTALAVGGNAGRVAVGDIDGNVLLWDLVALRAAIDALPPPRRWWDDVLDGFRSLVGGA